MALTVSCRCGQRLAIQVQNVGKPVACPACRAVFTVPVPVTLVPPPAAPSPPPASQAVTNRPADPAPPPPPAAEDELVELTADESEEELVELTADEPEEELVELSAGDAREQAKSPDGEEGGAYQVAGKGAGKVDASVAGGLGRIRLKANAIRCLAYGPDHQTALAADEDSLHFVDLNARKATRARPLHRAAVSCLAFSADGKWALSGDRDGHLLLWDVAGRKPLRWLEGARGEVISAAFAPGGRQVASGDAAGVIRVWDLGTGQLLPLQHARCEAEANCVCFSPDGRLVVRISSEGRARLWSVATGEVIVEMAKGAAGLDSAAFGSDGVTVLASCKDAFRVRRWDVRSGQRIPCFSGAAKKHAGVDRSLVVPNGRAVLTVRFVEQYAGRGRSNSPSSLGKPVGLGWAVGGVIGATIGATVGAAAWFAHKAATGGYEGAISPENPGSYVLEFWDVATQAGVCSAPMGPEEPLVLACSHDGHRVVAGFANGHIGLYGV